MRDTQAVVLETVVAAYANLLYAPQAVAVAHRWPHILPVRQAEAIHRADRFGIDAAERDATRLVETTWANLAAAQSRIQANIRRVEAAELALKGVRAEYGFSLRTMLDILIADESLRSA